MTTIFCRKKLNHFEVELSKTSSDLAQQPASRMRSSAISPSLINGTFEVLSLVKTVWSAAMRRRQWHVQKTLQWQTNFALGEQNSMHHLTALFFSPLVPMRTALWPVPQLIAPPPPEHLERSLTTNQNFLTPPPSEHPCH